MSGAATALVVCAAFAHALWNFHAKRAAVAGLPFLGLTTILGTAVYAPFAVWQLVTEDVAFGTAEVSAVVGSVALHSGYMLMLQHGYASGELSVVYPVARGLGPLFAIGGALLVFGERPAAQALLGGLVVCAAVAGLGGVGALGTSPRIALHSVAAAVITSVLIAAYTLWDARAVNELGIAPLVFTWAGSVLRLGMVAPLCWRHRASLRRVWRGYRRDVIAVAVFSPLAYLLVLIAFTMAPVSQVAPLRELSIVIATAFAVRLLGESHRLLRLALSAVVVGGVVLVVTAP